MAQGYTGTTSNTVNLQAKNTAGVATAVGFSSGNIAIPVQFNGTNGKLTYTIAGISLASLNGVYLSLFGSASKVMRISRIVLTAQAAGSTNVLINLRSTADTAGTSTTLIPTPNDSTNAASTATTVKSYSAAPTPGTLVNVIGGFISASSTANIVGCDYTFGQNGQELVLRGTSQGIDISSPATGANLNYFIMWTEE